MAKNKLLLSVRIKCIGQIHKIGLTKRGRLIFYNHTFDQFRQFEQLAELGGEACKCLAILEEWRKSEFNQTPTALQQQRLKKNKPDLLKIAWRTQRRLARLRPVEKSDSFSGSLLGNGDTSAVRKILADAVASVLTGRGYPVKTSDYGHICLPKSLPAKLSGHYHPQSHTTDNYIDYVLIRQHGHGYLVVEDILNYHNTLCHINRDTKPGVVCFIADYIERLCLFNKIWAAADRNYKRGKKYLEDLCVKGREVFDLDSRDNTLSLDKYSEDKSTWHLQLHLAGLTYQGAMQILHQYHKVTEQIERIRVASGRRAGTDQRWPPKPMQGIGRFGNQHDGGYSE